MAALSDLNNYCYRFYYLERDIHHKAFGLEISIFPYRIISSGFNYGLPIIKLTFSVGFCDDTRLA